MRAVELQDGREGLLHLGGLDDPVDEAMLEEVLGILVVQREVLAGEEGQQLGPDIGFHPGGFGQYDIPHQPEGDVLAVDPGVGQDGHVQASRLAEALEGAGDLGDPDQGGDPVAGADAGGVGNEDQGQVLLGRGLDQPGELLGAGRTGAAGEGGAVEDGHCGRGAVDASGAGQDEFIVFRFIPVPASAFVEEMADPVRQGVVVVVLEAVVLRAGAVDLDSAFVDHPVEWDEGHSLFEVLFVGLDEEDFRGVAAEVVDLFLQLFLLPGDVPVEGAQEDQEVQVRMAFVLSRSFRYLKDDPHGFGGIGFDDLIDDQFDHGEHVETVVLMSRVNK